MSEDNPATAIEILGVNKRFGSVVALDNISLTINRGELFFLLGPSGCGKTTLLRILAGLETPDYGTIQFNGQDIADLPPHQRGAPMVFQNYALWPHMSVAENVAFGLVEQKVPRAEIDVRVAEVLKKVNMGGLSDRMPGQLSGGQQQRVVLARALVINPGIILLDEPLSNLDAKLRLEMREEIEKLHADTDITFVYVTHDQTEALSLADRIAVMNGGKAIAIGAPLDLYHRPPNMFCAGFLGEANIFECRAVTSERTGLTVKSPFGTWRTVLASTGPLQAGDEVHCIIRPENLQVVTGSREGFNCLDAEIKALRPQGATMNLELDAGGITVKATALNQGGVDLRIGNRACWGATVMNTITIAKK